MADTGWLYPTDLYKEAGYDHWNGIPTIGQVQTVDGNRWYSVSVAHPDFAGMWTYFYDFSSIPVGATINGIEVQTRLYNQDASNNRTAYAWIALTWNYEEFPSMDWVEKSNERYIPAGNETYDLTWGGSSDNWGHSWLLSELTDESFVLRIRLTSSNSASSEAVDNIFLKVYYTEAGGPDYRGRSTRRDGRFTRRTKN